MPNPNSVAPTSRPATNWMSPTGVANRRCQGIRPPSAAVMAIFSSAFGLVNARTGAASTRSPGLSQNGRRSRNCRPARAGTPGGDTAEPGASGGAGAPIKVALIPPSSGALAQFGSDAADAWQFAVDEVNAAGGVAGHQIELIKKDTDATPATTLRAAREAVTQEGASFIGAVMTSTEHGALNAQLEGLGVLAGSYGTLGAHAYASSGDAQRALMLGVRLEGADNDYPFADDAGTRFVASDDDTRRLTNAAASIADLWLIEGFR